MSIIGYSKSKKNNRSQLNGVRYHIKKLRADGKIKREGSTKSGKWIVIK